MNPGYICEITYDNRLDPDSWLTALPVVRHLSRSGLRLEQPVTILVGENGTGKSTLLEAVAAAYGFNPEGGGRNFDFSTRETHSELYRHLTLARRAYPEDGYFLRAESLYNVATNIDELDAQPGFGPPIIASYGGVSLHEQSHGESFLAIVQNRFRGHGLYILDEPEAALSPMRILTLLTEIDRLVKNGSQLLISTHSPMLMTFPGAQILELTQAGIRPMDYRETEHFRTMRDFLNDPEHYLHYLLQD